MFPVAAVLEDALPGFVGEVEAPKARVVVLQEVDDAQTLAVVVESPFVAHQLREHPFSSVAKRRVAEVVDAAHGNPKELDRLGCALEGKFALVESGMMPGGRWMHRSEVMAEVARRARTDLTPSDHFLAGRHLGVFVLFLTLYATTYSGNSLLGYPGEAYRRGFSWIMATGFILYVLVFGHGDGRLVMPARWLPRLAALGILIYGGVGVVGMLMGRPFLDYSVLAHDPVHGQHLGVLLSQRTGQGDGAGLALTHRQAAQSVAVETDLQIIENRGHDIDELHRLFYTKAFGLGARPFDDERHEELFVVEREPVAEIAVFLELLAVIGGHHDCGGLVETPFCERGGDVADEDNAVAPGGVALLNPRLDLGRRAAARDLSGSPGNRCGPRRHSRS